MIGILAFHCHESLYQWLCLWLDLCQSQPLILYRWILSAGCLRRCPVTFDFMRLRLNSQGSQCRSNINEDYFITQPLYGLKCFHKHSLAVIGESLWPRRHFSFCLKVYQTLPRLACVGLCYDICCFTLIECRSCFGALIGPSSWFGNARLIEQCSILQKLARLKLCNSLVVPLVPSLTNMLDLWFKM